jgi:hypothetical protein
MVASQRVEGKTGIAPLYDYNRVWSSPTNGSIVPYSRARIAVIFLGITKPDCTTIEHGGQPERLTLTGNQILRVQFRSGPLVTEARQLHLGAANT